MAAIDPQEAAELLALLGGPDEAEPVPAPSRAVKAVVFDQWADAHGIYPGHSQSLTGGELYIHFLQWAAAEGLDVTFKRREWGGFLRRRGLVRGRTRKRCRDRWVWLLEGNAAKSFLDWLSLNPMPSGGPWRFWPKGSKKQGSEQYPPVVAPMHALEALMSEEGVGGGVSADVGEGMSRAAAETSARGPKPP
jgi:hypothetical protein